MKIKTIEQIKDEYAKEKNYSSWNAIGYDSDYEKRNNEIATRYASQFQTNTDLVTAEICALRERVAELEGFAESIVSDYENGLIEDIETVAIRAESLINKGNQS